MDAPHRGRAAHLRYHRPESRGWLRQLAVRLVHAGDLRVHPALAGPGRPRTLPPRPLRLLPRGLLVHSAGAPPAQAGLKVPATTPNCGSLGNELGGDKVTVYTATSPFQDVHRVDAKPSLLARA